MKPQIYSEFSDLKSVILSLGENLIDLDWSLWHEYVSDGELARHPETAPISRKIFISQLRGLYDLLIAKGIEVNLASHVENAICQVFTRDPYFVVGQTFYISQLQGAYRHEEYKGLNFLGNMQFVDLRNNDGNIIEGGDVFVVSSTTVLIGNGQTSNFGGFNLLKNHLMSQGFTNIILINHNALHLDCCFSLLPNGELMIKEDSISNESLTVLEKNFSTIHKIDPMEGAQVLAANILWINPSEVISNSQAIKTNTFLERMGYTIHKIDFLHVTGLWGSVRCTVCSVERD